jgi:hypothetical protein
MIRQIIVKEIIENLLSLRFALSVFFVLARSSSGKIFFDFV